MCPELRFSDKADHKPGLDEAIDIINIGKVVEPDGVLAGNHAGGPRDPNGSAFATAATGAATGKGNVAGRADADGSDAALTQVAASALEREALVPTGKVRPVVRGAWLILEGEVEVRTQRQAAEDAVRGLCGIRGVSNNIQIESEVMAHRVSRKIDEALLRNARLNANRISVTASNHKIILCGSVQSRSERAEAEAAAWGVRGVADVVNRIRATGRGES